VADHERSRSDAEPQALSSLVRAVGGVPVKVRTKLLVAFAVIAALLVLVAVLGLRVLGQSNARVESLGELQQRAAAYQSLQSQATQLRQLLAIRVGEARGLNAYLSSHTTIRGSAWVLADKLIIAAVSPLGPATDPAGLGFTPPRADRASIARIKSDSAAFSSALQRIAAVDRAGGRSAESQRLLTRAIDVDNDLSLVTDQLATRARAETDSLIAQNRSSYASSRDLFIGVGVASIVLAVLLGFVLSSSLVGPIQRTESRLAEIAAGDFTRRLEVADRKSVV